MAGAKKKGRKMYTDNNSSSHNRNHEDNILGVNSQIAEQLRAFYTSIEDEAIPARFLNLLEKLDAAEKGSHISTGVSKNSSPIYVERGDEND